MNAKKPYSVDICSDVSVNGKNLGVLATHDYDNRDEAIGYIADATLGPTDWDENPKFKFLESKNDSGTRLECTVTNTESVSRGWNHYIYQTSFDTNWQEIKEYYDLTHPKTIDINQYPDYKLMWENHDLSETLHNDYKMHDKISNKAYDALPEEDKIDYDENMAQDEAVKIDREQVGFDNNGDLMKKFSIPVLVKQEGEKTDVKHLATFKYVDRVDFNTNEFIALPEPNNRCERAGSGWIHPKNLEKLTDFPKYEVPKLYDSFDFDKSKSNVKDNPSVKALLQKADSLSEPDDSNKQYE